MRRRRKIALPKGVNVVSKRLADGTVVTYYYAWKGGPRLHGEPGTPEFYASYTAAFESQKRQPSGTLSELIDQYLKSSAFMNLAEKTKKFYKYCIREIEREFSDLPISALEERRVRGVIHRWRDEIAVRGPCHADRCMSVLARIVSWACDRSIIDVNHCRRMGRVYKGSRAENIWTVQQENTFYEKAPAHLHLALKLAIWTGQRQRDLLKLRWVQYDGSTLKFKQQKTSAFVPVPVARPLRDALERERNRLLESGITDAELRDLTILRTSAGAAWKSGFSNVFAVASKRAGVKGVTFHDLRGTAVTRLAIARCTVPEIAAITGHSLRDVDGILDKHYLKRDPQIALNAIRKLEQSLESQTDSQPPDEPGSD